MMKIKKLIFNPLQENTYIVFDETNECVIIDPGCQQKKEREALTRCISEAGLIPKAIFNTHCHFDHIFGNNFLRNHYRVELWAHEGEAANIRRFSASAALFGMMEEPARPPERFLADKMTLDFGNSSLEVLHTPGHSPGSVCFHSASDSFLIAGDTLFAGSIGRTDLPGGDYDEIMNSLKRLMTLPDETKVYCGHGSETSIGVERRQNPFLIMNYEL
jgi:glyoxylase-like metal-dependent hydrolase (beta-lactamase superfamily II)